MGKVIQHTNDGRVYLLVEVAEGARNIVHYDSLPQQVITWTAGAAPYSAEQFVRLEGQWQLIGIAEQLNYDQCTQIIKKKGEMFKDYLINGDPYHSSIKSLESLLQSHSLQPETTLIIQSK